MKTLHTLILLFLSMAASPQSGMDKIRHSNPLVSLAFKLYPKEIVTFETISKTKSMFDTDTVYSRARVMLQKHGDSIYYVNIAAIDNHKEFLFRNDTAWAVNHQEKIMRYTGTGYPMVAKSELSSHLPVTLFNLDTLVMYQAPYWHISKSDSLFDHVIIDIADKPAEFSDIIVEVVIGRFDSLARKSIQDIGFTNMTARYYHELTLDNYSFPAKDTFRCPYYTGEYGRVLPTEGPNTSKPMSEGDTLRKEIFIVQPELYDMDGNPFLLPKEGLIFIDLWYAGCMPCVKAAPVIERLYEEFGDSIHFYSLNEIDTDRSKIIRFKENMGIKIPVIRGGKDKLAIKVINRNSYPVFFLMDASNGKVLWSSSGYNELLEETVREILLRFLNNPRK